MEHGGQHPDPFGKRDEIHRLLGEGELWHRFLEDFSGNLLGINRIPRRRHDFQQSHDDSREIWPHDVDSIWLVLDDRSAEPEDLGNMPEGEELGLCDCRFAFG